MRKKPSYYPPKDSRLPCVALLLVTAAIFVLILGIGYELPRPPVADVIYVIGVAMFYSAILTFVVNARRAEAPYRKPINDPIIARKIMQKNVIQTLLFTTALSTSIYAVFGAFNMLHVVPIFYGDAPESMGEAGSIILPAMLCFLAALAAFLAGGAVHGSIAKLRNMHFSAPSARPTGLMNENDPGLRHPPILQHVLLLCVATGLGVIMLGVLVVDGDQLKYHGASEGWQVVVVFVTVMIAMLIALVNLFNSIPAKVQPRFAWRSTARGKLAGAGIALVVFATIGFIGYPSALFVLQQPTPSDVDLYLVRGFSFRANSSTMPTTRTDTWAMPTPAGIIDDLVVQVKGVAIAPCEETAILDYSVSFLGNGSVPLGGPYSRYSSYEAACKNADTSDVGNTWSWSGFPAATMTNFTVVIVLQPHAEHTEVSLNVTIFKVNRLTLLHWDKEDVAFMYGGIVFAGWFYALVAAITLCVGLARLRNWQPEERPQFGQQTSVWARKDTPGGGISW
jgi:hypothetical protein